MGNAQGQIILAGDFNQVLDGVLDKSRYSWFSMSKDRAAIRMLIEDNSLINVWQLVNLRKREYTFYSHCHRSYSRIDIILISQSLANAVTTNSIINTISLSDHLYKYTVNGDKLRCGRWRMNTTLLQDEAFAKDLAEDFRDYQCG